MSPFVTTSTCPEHAGLSRCGRLAESSLGDFKHKVVHVRAGRLELEGPRGVWAILPTHMVFIPAGRPYEIRTDDGTEVAVVHLDAPMTPWHHDGCWAAGTSPLAREMVDYALRWPRERDRDDPVAGSFFRTFGLLCADWFSRQRILWLPTGQSPGIRAAIRHVIANVDDGSLEGAASAAKLSPRTLRRHFREDTGMTWRQFVREARMMQAMEMLASGRHRISDVAMAVGFSSFGAFTQAFSACVGRTPSDFARSQRAGPGAAVAVPA